ncbi:MULTISPECIES: extracellular solute-binding protein [unclassified Paenibacillus]|uniref:extracellular solute-binding protein n=1 Tax=unclassified Paenibacillus TaxID=185978 RepID=UPI003641D0A8
MLSKRSIMALCTFILTVGSIVGCSGGSIPKQGENDGKTAESNQAPFEISMAIEQVGDIPSKGNEIEKSIEAYTNTKLNIQWIPLSTFNDKINVMIASNELPKLLRVKYNPTVKTSIQSGLFWEIGPLLKEYKNLSAQNPMHFSNLAVDGKLYGVPAFRDMGRATLFYRKDYMDALGLKLPVNLDDWYTVLKALAQNDPDKNGKNDTIGMVLWKTYNDGENSVLNRLSVNQGAPNRWAVENGKFIPAYSTKEFTDVLKLFRRLYTEKLLNQDFAVLEYEDAKKLFFQGRSAFNINAGANGKSFQQLLSNTDPKAVFDMAALTGPQGIKLPGETGSDGFFLIPKSAVKTEAELKQLLAFLDKLMDPEMSKLILRGVEGKHFVKTADNKTEWKDYSLFIKEVKPYKDNLTAFEGYNVPDLLDTPIGEKSVKLERENAKYMVHNPALTLNSTTYVERGKELEQMIQDAQTKFIMGKIDEAGWQAEIEKWRKSGGDKMAQEYEQDYARMKK